MFKYICTISILLVVNSCKIANTIIVASDSVNEVVLESEGAEKYLAQINEAELKEKLYYFASDEMEGRATGTKGHNRSDEDAVNVLAYIKGIQKPEELIVISAHYDHLGIDSNGGVNNGADDDGSGTIGMLQIAKAFAQAVKEGEGPKRSILFLHVVGEEIGLYGSRYYTENPIFGLENTVANLNIDMIGRVDEDHLEQKEYLYIIGSDKLSEELHLINEKVNQENNKLNFDYKFKYSYNFLLQWNP